ncbi:MAG: hypothetical protein U5Q16_08045 [Gammaproteobacteria bacterium]|nr:hypothetical protein [Gammaproteobacteria bacterium]
MRMLSVYVPVPHIAQTRTVAHLAEHLVRYKIPRSIEFVDEPLRDDAGKVRRKALREARQAPSEVDPPSSSA